LRIVWIAITWPDKTEVDWNRIKVIGTFGVFLIL